MKYTFADKPPHGGGYDDIVFVKGAAFLSASHPTLDAKGNSIGPSIVLAALVIARACPPDPLPVGRNSLAGQILVPHAVQLDQGVPDRHHVPVEPVALRPQELLENEVDELLLVIEAHERV